ncbi:excinuclease ABC subunit A [Chlamydia trachomatis]|uniref:UvrABC system protein A n=2 Tax=Chlamydia muridarum TaxID=83560 RepID=UVRA_CHLMU|nr:excinuclease ABC subunit UvrA [Chlamydia muridarum]Q9PK60.1 RecName: Full=UvrABC system protein A; Short=UvrA protein; AltName: Full=Excinuclease ABC subunit A [Chlamydia muridarum str. Nigg]UFT48587.1 excinuclease ABC subunit A [Chlamydia trachomatis]AAF39441.1 excinuclease ABC, subunit A [Chlamydia muridarum str. Nigg]AHH22997.1 excinuclease ABC subunit A [Chlamydia muridarum str. Nigg3 CMUT3-5]AHH23922.1 excinuclease ABC subunit A [Chlamydia muridarum str. Nigg CM972]AID38129.1 excinucl
MPSIVRLSGITVRNLKNVTVEFCPREIVLFTGVSGSGKSSLAFNTIYAAGRKRYITTLPSFFATRIHSLPDPAVKKVEGLSPTVAVKQNFFAQHVHATVGSTTEINSYLALLFSLDGQAYDPITLRPLTLYSKEKILAEIAAIPDGTQLTLLAPLPAGDILRVRECLRQGFTKILIDGEISPIHKFLATGVPVPSQLIIDTLIKNASNTPRLKVSLFTTLDIGHGECCLHFDNQKRVFSTQTTLPETQNTYTPLSPDLFSSHSHKDRCPQCHGSGIFVSINDPSIIQQNLSIEKNCCPFAGSCSILLYKTIYQSLADNLGFSLSTPWQDLSPEIQHIFLYGKEGLSLPVKLFDGTLGKTTQTHKQWKGVLNEIGEKIRFANKPSRYLPKGTSYTECPRCQKTGLSDYANAAKWHGKSFADLQQMSLQELFIFLNQLPPKDPAIEEVIQGLKARLAMLIDLGLPYLSPERSVNTLSGGEQERTALAKHLGAELMGVTYVLDEPSIGLHPQDTYKLMDVIKKLRDQGNTILLVEHDEQMISLADRVIDVGPGAGIFGGEVVFNGTPKEFLANSHSLTAQYLRQEQQIPIPAKRQTSLGSITLSRANKHNLKNLTVSIPLGQLTVVTGVSGSGKSSLINDTLVPCVEEFIEQGSCPNLAVQGKLSRLVHINRDLPGRSQRSISLTYIKAFDELRQLFAEQPRCKPLGLTKSHFSFNTPLGACSECGGLGSITAMDNQDSITCPSCSGKRFLPQVLEIRYKNKTIADILEMTAYEAESFFLDQPSIHNKIQALCTLGLQYLPLGRPLYSLSGGEIQRLKLACELSNPVKHPTLYVLDEPTTGLHTHDVKQLIHVLQSLTDQGHSVVIIEHNMHVVKIADYVLELGPEGGNKGGCLIASCSPEELIHKHTPTSLALRPFLSQHQELPHLPDLRQQPPIPAAIIITNAHHHNLKHIDVSIPRYALTTVTGPSASGKHSLVFDVLHAAGNISYAELFPPYIRQALIKKTPLPSVDKVIGLSPVIAIEKNSAKNSSHSVASALEISDMLEELFTQIGRPYSPVSGDLLKEVSPQTIAEELLENYAQGYVTITIPFPPEEDFFSYTQEMLREGFLKLYANEQLYDLEGPFPDCLESPALVIHHVKILEKNIPSILSSLSLAFSKSSSIRLHIENYGITTSKTYQLGLQDSLGNSFPSNDNTTHLCPFCHGNGSLSTFSILPYKNRFAEHTPLSLFTSLFPNQDPTPIYPLLEELGIPSIALFQEMDDHSFQKLCLGTLQNPGFDALCTKAMLAHPTTNFPTYLISETPCNQCQGNGTYTYEHCTRIHDISLSDIYQSDVPFLKKFLLSLGKDLPLVSDIFQKLELLERVGLSQVILGQEQSSLSDGERYQLLLAKAFSSGLTDVIYLLEDPLAGIHPKDAPSLLSVIKDLVANHNTVVVTDREGSLSKHADHVIHLGPEPGPNGGYLLETSAFRDLQPISQSTYISDQIPKLSVSVLTSAIQIDNLSIPLRSLSTISGVSGSGKTTLLLEGIYKSGCAMLEKDPSLFSEIIFLDSHPQPASSRSDISTYFDIAPSLRNFFSSLTQAKALNISASMFSPNTKQGQCSDCWGLGYQLIDRAFYAMEKRSCPTCGGFRVQPLVQEVVYEGKHFGQLLQSSLNEVAKDFSFLKKVQKPLQTLIANGLGYLPLGQNMSSLSLSEKIAIKITKYLFLPPKHPTLFLLDGVATSLDNQQKYTLLSQLKTLVSLGHTVVIIENHPAFSQYADFLIQMGHKTDKTSSRIIFSGINQSPSLSNKLE